MPEGIYLNANLIPPDQMARTMNEIIDDPKKYYEFFRWHDHYSFHYTGEDLFSREFCELCAFLNNSKNKTGIMYSIVAWWNVLWPLYPMKVDEQNKAEEIFTNVLNFLDPSSD